VRQPVYFRLAGAEDLNDPVRVSADPTFRLIGSKKNRDRGGALTSRLRSFETGMPASGWPERCRRRDPNQRRKKSSGVVRTLRKGWRRRGNQPEATPPAEIVVPPCRLRYPTCAGRAKRGPRVDGKGVRDDPRKENHYSNPGNNPRNMG
jgi:hypothetical protein